MLGGAKRVSMARKFIDAGKRRGMDVQLFSYELSAEVPVSIIADIVIGKRWNDPLLIEHLHETVKSLGIDIMIPFVDGAVGATARYINIYDDVWAPVGTLRQAEIMFDKVLAAEIFEENGIDIPHTYTRGAPPFPIIAKPRRGSASKGIKILRDVNDFRAIQSSLGDYLLQEFIEESNEYTVDCYITHDGTTICTVPRKRLEVTGGEVSRTITLKSAEIMTTAQSIINKLGLTGAVTIQFIEDRTNGRLMLMEINPRLGGGAVCSVAAGADIPGFILSEFTGDMPAPSNDWRDKTEIARYFDEVTFFHDEK